MSAAAPAPSLQPEAPAPPPSTRGLPRVFAVTWFAYASYYFGRKGFSVAKAAIAGQLSLSTASLAAIDTAFLVAYAIGQVPSGLCADRFGARRLVGYGLLASAVACTLFGFAQSAVVLAACFALNGLAQSTGWPGTTRAMAEWTAPRQRGRIMGAWSTCYQAGGIAATALAAYLLAHHGVRAVFVAPAAWLALAGIGVLALLPESRSATRLAAPSRAPDLPQASHAPRPTLRLVFDSPVLLSYGACYFCLKLIRYSLLFWLPYYLHTSAGFAQATSGYLSTSFEIGGVAGSVGVGYLSDRTVRSRAAVAFAALVLLTLALLLYARLSSAPAPVHFAAMALIGALLFGPDALLSGAAAQDAGGAHAAATAAGMVNGMGSIGSLLSGALTVAVQQAFGWQALFYAFVALSAAACACLLPAVRRRPFARGG